MAAGFQAAIFDVDGVLVDSPHEEAWRESLRELMESDWADVRERTTWSPDAFTSRLYQHEISGKPRMAGARAALGYFGVPDIASRAREYADRKQALVTRLISEGDFTPYPDALRFVVAVKEAGVPLCAASSSKNASALLRSIGLDDLFDADVSGRDFARGKPDPEMFLAAAAELGAEPERSFVVEDAVAGVEAAKAGGMAALAIARADDADLLAEACADLVVTTLDAVDLAALSAGSLATSRD
jgi:beta-phosphoglucomutase